MQCNNDQFYEFFSFLLHWLIAKVKTGNIHFFLDGGGGITHKVRPVITIIILVKNSTSYCTEVCGAGPTLKRYRVSVLCLHVYTWTISMSPYWNQVNVWFGSLSSDGPEFVVLLSVVEFQHARSASRPSCWLGSKFRRCVPSKHKTFV